MASRLLVTVLVVLAIVVSTDAAPIDDVNADSDSSANFPGDLHDAMLDRLTQLHSVLFVTQNTTSDGSDDAHLAEELAVSNIDEDRRRFKKIVRRAAPVVRKVAATTKKVATKVVSTAKNVVDNVKDALTGDNLLARIQPVLKAIEPGIDVFECLTEGRDSDSSSLLGGGFSGFADDPKAAIGALAAKITGFANKTMTSVSSILDRDDDCKEKPKLDFPTLINMITQKLDKVAARDGPAKCVVPILKKSLIKTATTAADGYNAIQDLFMRVLTAGVEKVINAALIPAVTAVSESWDPVQKTFRAIPCAPDADFMDSLLGEGTSMIAFELLRPDLAKKNAKLVRDIVAAPTSEREAKRQAAVLSLSSEWVFTAKLGVQLALKPARFVFNLAVGQIYKLLFNKLWDKVSDDINKAVVEIVALIIDEICSIGWLWVEWACPTVDKATQVIVKAVETTIKKLVLKATKKVVLQAVNTAADVAAYAVVNQFDVESIDFASKELRALSHADVSEEMAELQIEDSAEAIASDVPAFEKFQLSPELTKTLTKALKNVIEYLSQGPARDYVESLHQANLAMAAVIQATAEADGVVADLSDAVGTAVDARDRFEFLGMAGVLRAAS